MQVGVVKKRFKFININVRVIREKSGQAVRAVQFTQ